MTQLRVFSVDRHHICACTCYTTAVHSVDMICTNATKLNSTSSARCNIKETLEPPTNHAAHRHPNQQPVGVTLPSTKPDPCWPSTSTLDWPLIHRPTEPCSALHAKRSAGRHCRTRVQPPYTCLPLKAAQSWQTVTTQPPTNTAFLTVAQRRARCPAYTAPAPCMHAPHSNTQSADSAHSHPCMRAGCPAYTAATPCMACRGAHTVCASYSGTKLAASARRLSLSSLSLKPSSSSPSWRLGAPVTVTAPSLRSR